ncbi:hypothetical protein OIU84_017725 [Salix udensis]|uniref:Endonuclease/exonuclease/phosphatase domain-containing protein n=1 Tax=Salix udensis TaxID=889485 RepID=A0AAD6L2H9_9ROSI|nr:hypothetical protein OIU84_017725 [Salix udensis]
MDTTKEPPQHQAQCSWAGKVRVSDSSTRCTLERLARQPVGSILTIPQDMQMADSAIWKRSMVGFFQWPTVFVMCMENKDSVGSSVHERERDKGKGVIEENSDSFFNGNFQASPMTSSSSSPKQKKKKKGGKKKKEEAEGLRMIDVTLIHSSAQWMTCDVRSISNSEITRITFVYGMNGYVDRSTLWHYIQESSVHNTNIPWTLLGDFNAIMRPSDRCGGSNNWVSHHDDLPNCIMLSSLQQIPYTGMHLSWHNGVMVLSLDAPHCRDKPPFKFLNQWAKHEDFLGMVNSIWQQRIVGNPIFQLTTKLMLLKAQFLQKPSLSAGLPR